MKKRRSRILRILVQLIYHLRIHITTYLISLLYLYDHMNGKHDIYKTVCLLLWGRGAGSANDHGLKTVVMLYILSSLKSSQHGIGLYCSVINQETHSPCCMPSTCSHPKSIFLWLKKFSVQRDLHVESRLRLQVVQDRQTLAVKQLEPTCISVW